MCLDVFSSTFRFSYPNTYLYQLDLYENPNRHDLQSEVVKWTAKDLSHGKQQFRGLRDFFLNLNKNLSGPDKLSVTVLFSQCYGSRFARGFQNSLGDASKWEHLNIEVLGLSEGTTHRRFNTMSTVSKTTMHVEFSRWVQTTFNTTHLNTTPLDIDAGDYEDEELFGVFDSE